MSIVLALFALLLVTASQAGGASGTASIVVLERGTDAAALARGLGLEPRYVYTHALDGFAASIPADVLARLRDDPRVVSIEPDGRLHALGTEPNPPSWGLDRIDQHALPLDHAYGYATTGSGVTAYVIDTGIRLTHQEFGGRAVAGYDAVLGLSPTDCNGHGTHVSGTIGGATYGVAKAVRLVAVRVLTCAGTGATSSVIAGVDWVTGNHQAGQPAVANMSLGGGKSAALDTAVRNSIADGITYAVAAGNDGTDACAGSPADVPEAITVGATDANDARADFSDVGSCVDLFAPGVDIVSAWWLTDTSSNTLSGTSMATPHVVGAAAKVLEASPSATPAQVAATLASASSKAAVTDAQSPHPDLLFSN